MTAKPTQKPARPAARSATAPATHAHAAQEVRIMGGQWKRTPLPVADLPGLRPTPGRVRETLFNWLGQDLSGWRCVDAFAGSGALGLEAASRGAAEVLLIEHNAQLVDALRAVLLRLKAQQVKLERTDALVALRRLAGQGWDVVFLDPPFLQGDNDTLCLHALAAAAQAVAPTGRVYLESPRVWSDDELVALGLVALKRGRAGAVHYSLLQPLPAATAASPTESDTPAGACPSIDN